MTDNPRTGAPAVAGWPSLVGWLPPIRILAGSAWLLGGELANRGSRFLITVLVARRFGPDGLGEWSFALSLALLFALLAEFGLPVVIAREVARDPGLTDRYMRQGLTLKLVLSLLTYGAIGATLPALAPDGSAVPLLLLLGIFAILDTYAQLFYAVFRARQRMELEAMSKLAQGLALVGVGGMLIAGGQDLVLVAMAPLAAAAIGLALALVMFRRFAPLGLTTDLRASLSLLWSALPIFVSSLAFLVYFRIDTVLVSLMKGDVETGLYNAAYNFIFPPLALAPLLFVNALFPSLSSARSQTELRDLYRRGHASLGLYALAVTVLVLATHRTVYLGIYGSEFEDSVRVLFILLPAAVLSIFSNLNYYVLVAANRERSLVLITLAGAVANVGLNLLLIPPLGAEGAATATVITEAGVLLVLLLQNRRLVWSQPNPGRAPAD